jgi:flagellar hook assembly protein FlgD
LVDGDLDRRRHQVVWDGRDDAGNTVSSGVYMYRLRAGNFTATRKMLVIR